MADFFIHGQKALEVLKRDVQMNTVRQGYIFEGTDGIGKKTVARKFAAMLFCTGEAKPCGTCHGCRMFQANTHPDFFVMDESPVKIDSIRKMNDELFVRPLISDRKVFIIEHADEMNTESQNAFLKSFEEPPSYAVLVLITSSVHRLLPTILSRGTKVSFQPFSMDKIEKFVSDKYSLAGARAGFIARYSAGIVGRAMEICENEEILKKRDDILKSLMELSNEKASILPVVEAMGASRRDMPADGDFYFDVIMSFFRDIAALKMGGSLINTDYESQITAFAKGIRGASARRCVDIISKTKADFCSNIKAKMKYDLWITNMLIICWEEIYGTGNRS
ncbi:MAG: DNA polymerase III subunit [Clostridia bacterium]|nr:DNA polymerase III subunit [Clostridia bacterium]